MAAPLWQPREACERMDASAEKPLQDLGDLSPVMGLVEKGPESPGARVARVGTFFAKFEALNNSTLRVLVKLTDQVTAQAKALAIEETL